MEPDIKRWTVKRKAALAMEISQGKTTAAQASLSFDIAFWEIKEQYKRQIKDLQEAYGEVMLELRTRKCKLRRSQGRCTSWPPEGSQQSRQSVCCLTGQIYLLLTLGWGA